MTRRRGVINELEDLVDANQIIANPKKIKSKLRGLLEVINIFIEIPIKNKVDDNDNDSLKSEESCSIMTELEPSK